MADKKGESVLRAMFEFSDPLLQDGRPSVDRSPETPMARALDWAINEGKPFRRISYLFFEDREGDVAWLGAFAQTQNRRISFFPGFMDPGVRWMQGRLHRPTFLIDHITLQTDQASWHMTGTDPNGGQRLTGGPTATLDMDAFPTRRYWLGMTIQSPKVLRRVSRFTVVSAHIPSTDGERRLKLFQAIHGDAVHTVIDTKSIRPGGVWHFNFVVGSPDKPLEIDQHALVLPDSPALDPPIPPRLEMYTFAERIHLATDVIVDVYAAPLPGVINGVTALLTSSRG